MSYGILRIVHDWGKTKVLPPYNMQQRSAAVPLTDGTMTCVGRRKVIPLLIQLECTFGVAGNIPMINCDFQQKLVNGYFDY